MPLSRRSFMQRSAVGGVGLLTFMVAGCEKQLAPAEAKATGVPLRTLSAAEARTLESLGEILLPGSAAAGLTHYIDHQLSGPPPASMLIIKYLGVNPPFTPFYQSGLAGTEAAAQKGHGKSLKDLDAAAATAFVTAMSRGELADWAGPPPALFFFVLRSDAIDAVYGTQLGFEKLGVPYMPHIVPASRWDE
jgi:hypothetical protein